MSDITFENFDKLGRKPFAEQLTKAISTFYPFYDGAYVLSLNAKYGNGKTTFLNMWKDYLEAEGHKVIYINAWETDFDNEPLIPIATDLINGLGNSDTAEKAKIALRGVLGAGALIANSIVEKFLGINAKNILEEVEKGLKSKELQGLGEQISTSYHARQLLYENLKSALSEYVETLDKKPLIILVDELDRVRPNYAVEFLEAIKHIFSVQGVCFVLAVDREQLEVSVSQLYGNIDFNNYYLRFITREANLPAPEFENVGLFTAQLMGEFFERKLQKQIPFIFSDNQKTTIKTHAEYIIYTFGFSLREAEHLFRIYAQFLAVDSQSDHYDNWLRAALTLIAFSIKFPDIYNSIIRGQYSPDDFSSFLDEICNIATEQMTDTERCFILDTTAFLLDRNNTLYQDQAFQILQKFSIGVATDQEGELSYLARYYDLPSHSFPRISGFQSFGQKLEHWRDFLG